MIVFNVTVIIMFNLIIISLHDENENDGQK